MAALISQAPDDNFIDLKKKFKDDNYLKCLLCLAKFLMIIAVYATYVYLPMVRWGPISTNIAESLLYNLLDYSAFLII